MENKSPSLGQVMLDLEDQFYASLEEADNLIDYFCLVGLDQ